MKTLQLSIIVILLLSIININMIFAQVKQSNVLSPLKQLRLGVSAENISCNSGFHLLTKSSDHSPACVKTTSIKRLVAQGWIIVPELNKSFSQNNTVSNKVLDTRNKAQTLGIIVVTYFDPTSKDWDLIYKLADNYSSTVRYVIINPCNGPCDTPLSSDWQSIISNLKARGIKTLGYIFDNSQSIANIDYYMKTPKVPTDGIFFDNEGSTGDNSVYFKQYSDYVHKLGGIVYINPGYPYPYLINYLKSNLADIVNVYEPNPSEPNDIPINYNVSPSRLSVMLGNVSSISDMHTDLTRIASKGIGNVFIYENSYYSLPSFFVQEVQLASVTKMST